jgi:hypothetical protein
MSIENELVHMTIRDLLSLIDNPSDTFQRERRWLSENTSVIGWGHILPIAVAHQILARDPQGQVMRILEYKAKIFRDNVTILVGITPLALQHSGELSRLAREAMGPIHLAKQEHYAHIEACAQIIDGFKRRLKMSKGISDALVKMVEAMASQCNYDPKKLQGFLNDLLSDSNITNTQS